MPELSLTVEVLIVKAYVALMLLTLITLIPMWRRYFTTARWDGYIESTPLRDRLYSPLTAWILLAVWTASLLAMWMNAAGPWAALLNAAICYHFFIRQRWCSLLRGMGAPGFMSWWIAMAILGLQLSNHFATNLRGLVVLAFQVDFALIMFSAGFYKLTAGYLQNHGMEVGMVNPMWGYASRFFARFSPNHGLFWFLNQMAWSTEIVASILMLIPNPMTRILGAAMIAGSFVFVGTQIRLNLLTEMVILSCAIFIPANGWLDQHLTGWVSTTSPAAVNGLGEPWLAVFQVLLWAYIVLRPMTLLGLYYNFYVQKTFWRPLQKALEKWANTFGIILWRVFTQEVTNFYIRIQREGETAALSHYTNPFNWRFNNVAEAIAVATLFTTKKYFASNKNLFLDRLRRYARTLSGEKFEFTYVSILKEGSRFVEREVIRYHVNAKTGEVQESVLSSELAARFGQSTTAAKNCAIPGSYAPVPATN
ncbi:MAG: hypothetical protein AB7N80_08260 [Bdellovibrionales bacterium]